MIYEVAAIVSLESEVCTDCDAPLSWSPDGTRLIYLRSHRDEKTVDATVYVLDIGGAKRHLALDHPRLPLYAAHLSFDGNWITFKGDLEGGPSIRSIVFVAPLRGDTMTPVKDWIPITEGEFRDDIPRWSPHGDLIYFTSDRDGYVCVWAQRLDPTNKPPVGKPFAVRHFHELRQSLSMLSLSHISLAVARDKLVFPVGELRGNVWLLEPLARKK